MAWERQKGMRVFLKDMLLCGDGTCGDIGLQFGTRHNYSVSEFASKRSRAAMLFQLNSVQLLASHQTGHL